MGMNTESPVTKIHKFEAAGLGKAPFTFIGMEEKTYTACPGAPTQAAGTCDHCGRGIRYCCHIQSADGKQFVVGSGCVTKTGDEGLRKIVDRKKSEIDAAKRHASEAVKIEAGQKLIADNAAAIAALPHPNAHLASQGKTLADYAAWIWENAGNSGKLSLIRDISKLVGK